MKRTIFKRILSGMLLTGWLCVTVTGLFFSAVSTVFLTKRITGEIISQAKTLGRIMVSDRSERRLSDYMENEQGSLFGTYLYLYDTSGALIVFSESSTHPFEPESYTEIVRKTIAERTDQVSYSMSWQIRVAVPVTDRFGAFVGVLVLEKETSEVKEAAQSLLGLFLVIFAGCAVFTMFPAYRVSKDLAKPIQQMTAVSERMSAGDFSVRAETKDTGEIGHLGAALNNLSESLSDTIRELKDARERLRSILENIGDGVVAVSADFSTVTYQNPAAARLCEQIGGLGDLLTGESKNRLLSEDEPSVCQISRADRCIHVSAERTEQGEYVLVLRDVTEAERLEQTRRDYVANVSHELRTPVASIRSLAETLNDGVVVEEAERRKYYGYILGESLRLSRLINDLLELSRLQSGAGAFEQAVFDPYAALSRLMEGMRDYAEDHGVELRLSCPSSGSNIRACKERIEQVLMILLDNGIKYADEDGFVSMSVSEKNDLLVYEVRNCGHIDERDLPYIFDRFYKADRSHSGNGTGLGLSIAREIVTLMNGAITAENSESEAIFTFEIPYDRNRKTSSQQV